MLKSIGSFVVVRSREVGCDRATPATLFISWKHSPIYEWYCYFGELLVQYYPHTQAKRGEVA